jgi:uncharacterized membrane protein YhiD involved in acid resistance
MIFAIANLLMKLLGLDFETAIKYARLALIAIVGLIVLITTVFIFKACNRPPKLNEKQIQKVQQAIEKQERTEMVETLAQIEVETKQIDANLANADNEKLKAFAEARKRARELTNEQLAKELEALK